MMAYDDIALTNNTALSRFELKVDDSIAFIEYKYSHELLFLIHTEVPPALKGKGVAGVIVQKTLQYAEANHHKIVPICPFVQSFLKKHPEWNAIVAPNADRFLHNH